MSFRSRVKEYRLLFSPLSIVTTAALLCFAVPEISAKPDGTGGGGGGGGGNGGGGSQEQISLEFCVTSVSGDIQDDGQGDYCHSSKNKIRAIIGDKKTGFNMNTSNGDNGRRMTVTLEGLGSQTFSHFILNIFNTDGSDFNYFHFADIPVGATTEVSIRVQIPAEGFTNPWWWLNYGVTGEPIKPTFTRESENSFSLHVGDDVVAYLSVAGTGTDLGQGSVPFDLEATEAP